MNAFCMEFMMKSLLLGVICFCMISCDRQISSPSKTPPIQKDQPLLLNLFCDPPTLDPARAHDMTSAIVVQLLYEGLTRLDPGGKVELALAKKITCTEDQKTFYFTLRSSFWSNGDPLTSDDFRESWLRILDPEVPAETAHQLFLIRGAKEAKQGLLPPSEVGISAPDPSTLIVELEEPAPYFKQLISGAPFQPIHSSSRTGRFTPAVVNGPYRLNHWQRTYELELDRNSHFWDAENVHLPQIRFCMVEDPRTELLLYQKGELHWAGHPFSCLPWDQLPKLQKENLLCSQQMAGVYWYQVNPDHPLLSNKKIRRALSLALDRETLVTTLLHHTHQPTTRILPPFLGKPSEKSSLTARLVEAQESFREGIAEAGFAPGDPLPPIRLSFNLNEDHLRLVQALQAIWHSAFGLEIELSGVEWRVHLSRMQAGDFDIGRFGWVAQFQDGSDFLNQFQAGAIGPPLPEQWESNTFLRLCAEAKQVADPDARLQALLAAEQELLDSYLILPLFSMVGSALHHPDLKGVVWSPCGVADFRWAYWDPSS